MSEMVPNVYRIERGGRAYDFPRDDLETAALLLLEHDSAQMVAHVLRNQYGWANDRIVRTVLAADKWLRDRGDRS